MLKEFREFAMRGNVVDMAVGIIVGAAFGTIVKVLVAEVMMPPLGLLIGDIDFASIFTVLKQGDPVGPYATVEAAKEAGAVVMAWGLFFNEVVSFVIVAFAVFLLIKAINTAKRKEDAPAPAAPTTKDCPECLMTVPLAATRCGHCTSAIPQDG